MSNTFTLDSFREEADKSFAPFKVSLSDGTEVTLCNLLRLPSKTRQAVKASLETLNGGDGVELDALIAAASKVIETVSDENGKKLVKEIDGDLGVLLGVVTAWASETQLGEADDSPN